MKPRYFFDASAIIRVYDDDPSFAPFVNEPMVTERGHVYEFARHTLKTRNASEARAALLDLRTDRVEPTDADLVEAAKLSAKSSRLSAQDALGYVLARRERLTFLTTDRAFRGLPGVEIVGGK